MKFRIRYADQIVGLFIIIAILSLVTIIFFLGSTQRWFSRNYSYKTYASSASGLSQNMQVIFKGVAIGNVKSFLLSEDNRVEVIFTIHDNYRGRVKEGSLVEILVSPIGMGNQFIFHAGLGDTILEEGSLVPMYNSPEGKEYINRGIGYKPSNEDSIAALLSTAQGVFGDLRKTVNEVNLALEGNENTPLGQSITNIQNITGSVGQVTERLADGDTINALESSLLSLSQTLDHVEQSTVHLPREMPHIYDLIARTRTTIQAAEDVLISLRNNPLLRKGIPEHAEIDSSGTNPRNITF
ncbi:hypothetical protein AGMMS50230_01750 [Spirochaetia bacterium]|nr:hypothetical protein AGMMS50230_01750 [Spirochaetia bacterium]